MDTACSDGSSPFASLPGADAREVAGEVVRPRVHQLLQVLQQERRLELRGAHVGSVFLWAEAVSGEPLLLIPGPVGSFRLSRRAPSHRGASLSSEALLSATVHRPFVHAKPPEKCVTLAEQYSFLSLYTMHVNMHRMYRININ